MGTEADGGLGVGGTRLGPRRLAGWLRMGAEHAGGKRVAGNVHFGH